MIKMILKLASQSTTLEKKLFSVYLFYRSNISKALMKTKTSVPKNRFIASTGLLNGIVRQMGHCIGGNFNIHIWA